MAKNKRRWAKEPSLIKQIFKPTYNLIYQYPKLITKMELSDITIDFMKIFAYQIKEYEEFEIVLHHLQKLNLIVHYFNLYIIFLCKFDFGLLLLEKYLLLKNSLFSLDKLSVLQSYGRNMVVPKKLKWDWHETAFNYYSNIYYNYCNFHYNAIPYMNYKNTSTYHYFNICRLCCENEPTYFNNIDIKAFGTKTVKYYLRLAKYLELIYGIKDLIIQDISNLKEDNDVFFVFMPVTSNTVKMYPPVYHQENNLTVALAQSFTIPIEVPKGLPKTKVFKFSDIELDSDDVQFIVNEVQKIS